MNTATAVASDSSPANRGTGADAGKEEMEELNSELSEMVKATLEIQEDLEEFKKERREFETSTATMSPLCFFGLRSVYISLSPTTLTTNCDAINLVAERGKFVWCFLSYPCDCAGAFWCSASSPFAVSTLV